MVGKDSEKERLERAVERLQTLQTLQTLFDRARPPDDSEDPDDALSDAF